MAIIDDYDSLRTEVANMLARQDLTTYIPGWIQAAESRIYRECLVRQMEAQDSSLTSSGTLAVPSGTDATYVALKEAFIAGSPAATVPVSFLERVSYPELLRQYPLRAAGAATAGTPVLIARRGAVFEFGPFPDTDYTVTLNYYARPDAMSGAADAPWPITESPDLILYASLLQSAPFLMEDPRLQVWEVMYQQAKAGLLEEYGVELMSGSRSQERRIA